MYVSGVGVEGGSIGSGFPVDIGRCGADPTESGYGRLGFARRIHGGRRTGSCRVVDARRGR